MAMAKLVSPGEGDGALTRARAGRPHGEPGDRRRSLDLAGHEGERKRPRLAGDCIATSAAAAIAPTFNWRVTPDE
jgi:hypothetical protein